MAWCYGDLRAPPAGATRRARDPGAGRIGGVTYGNGTFVAVGEYDKFLTSPDGVNWTVRSSGSNNNLLSFNAVTYGNGNFVAVGVGSTVFGNKILTSPDGVTWTARDAGTTYNLNGVACFCGNFVAVGDGGTILQTGLGLPELVINDISAPLYAIPQETIDISYTINNIGEGDAARINHGCFFCSGQDINPDCATIFTSEQEEINIPASQSYTVSKKFLIPDVPSGTYYISARVGYDDHADSNGIVLTRPIIIGETGGLTGTYSGSSDAAENLRSQKATLKNGTVKVMGSKCGDFEFKNIEIVDIETGSFAGKGFSKGNWAATINSNQYSGYFKGVSYLLPSENKVYLKGVVGGQARGVFEGYLTQAAAGGGNYDQYSSTWKVNLGGSVSAVLDAAGTLAYTDSASYPETRLHVLQSGIDGLTAGDYAEPISTVLTHVRVDDENNPYNGQGFSIISYTSERGSGEGWTYDTVTAPGVVESNGMFSAPLSGIVLGNLDESESPVKQYLSIENLALTPMADLEVKSWGPGRVSPGQMVNYVVEYRNDGFNSAENTVVVLKLPFEVDYVSSTGEGIYRWDNHEVIWKLGTLPPHSIGILSCKVLVNWGLIGHTWLEGLALIGTTSEEYDISYLGVSPIGDIYKYLEAQPSLVPNGQIDIGDPVELDTLLEDEKFLQMYNDAERLGYRSGDVILKIIYDNGSILSGPIMIDQEHEGCIWLVKNSAKQNGSPFIIKFSENAISFIDEDGELKILSDGSIDKSQLVCGKTLNSEIKKSQELPPEPCIYNACKWNCLTETVIWGASWAAGQKESKVLINAGKCIYESYKLYSECNESFNLPGCALKVTGQIISCTGGRFAADLLTVAGCVDNCIASKQTNPNLFMCIPGTRKSHCDCPGFSGQNKYTYVCNYKCFWDLVDIENCSGNCPNGYCYEDFGSLYGYASCNTVNCNENINKDTIEDEIITAQDPNAKYGPEGSVLAGEELNYKVEFENEGEGIAFGVYFKDTLDEDLDASTLEIGPVYSTADASQIAPAGIYNPATRTITWFVGEVGSIEGGYAEISVKVRADAPGGTEIINYATVYFPSVPETTLTNAIVSAINLTDNGITGSFTFQVAPESANIPQAEVSLWTAGGDRSTATPILNKNVNVTANGNNGTFQLTNIDPGNYDITFKLPNSLRAIKTNITITQDTMTPVNFGEITLGDTWGEEGPDNVVDVSDYSAILYSFGTIPGDEKYIDTCDLNRDGVVDVSDYSIVLYNFGEYGETPF